MGRPFTEELAELEETHKWACALPVGDLADKLRLLFANPLLAVGSGGSLSTATVAATLFRRSACRLSSAITPLELSAMRHALRDTSVLIATAGGSNPDVIGTLRTAAQNDAQQVLAICCKIGSKLAGEVTKFSNVEIEEFNLPSKGDGFLATNSLWASSVLLQRAFAEATQQASKVPNQLPKLVRKSRWDTFVNTLSKRADELWARETLIVLYGESSHPAAVDLESKLSEAALSNVWIANYRHFAHGRHHWLAKRGATSSVVAFVEPSEKELAERTLAEIPSDVPTLRIDLPDNQNALLIALAHVFPITRSAGLARSIDPGRPGVPSFGRRIYRLNAFGKMAESASDLPALETVAIERKSGQPLPILTRKHTLAEWRNAYSRFVDALSGARFHAIVFDYDATLCGASERFSGLKDQVSAELIELLRAGIDIGIATGRGKSVRESLRNCIPKKFWKRISVGYYNGGQIGTLSDDAFPDGTARVTDSLSDVLATLKANKQLQKLSTIEGRLKQITVSASDETSADECWYLANHIIHQLGYSNVQLLRSSHSFDVLPTSVTKIDVVKLFERKELKSSVLAIGDMGNWPGNDYALLSHPYSLSVDQVSPDRDTCWNLASPGVRGVDATIEYLKRLQVNSSCVARLKLKHKQAGARR